MSNDIIESVERRVAMSIGERVRKVRENAGLSRREFGDRLGINEGVIINIEFERLKNPEKKEPVYRLICSEFSVNENWLRTGEGEMYRDMTDAEKIAAFVGEVLRSDDFRLRTLKMLSSLDEDGWRALEIITRKIKEEG